MVKVAANGRSYAPVRDCEVRPYPTSRDYDTETAACKPLKPAWLMSCCWQTIILFFQYYLPMFLKFLSICSFTLKSNIVYSSINKEFTPQFIRKKIFDKMNLHSFVVTILISNLKLSNFNKS